VCPSCGVNMADLPDGHRLAMSGGREHENAPLEPMTGQCARGVRVTLSALETLQAAANIALYDDFRAREAEAFSRMLGAFP
jgi:hypothetical protein